jgi:hypothetical protein
MKKTIRETIEVEVEIQLPYYFKDICHAYAISTEETAICITYALKGRETIENRSCMIDYILAYTNKKGSVEITKDEFKKIYDEVELKLKNII